MNLLEIKARKREIRATLESGNPGDLDAIETELRQLEEEEDELEIKMRRGPVHLDESKIVPYVSSHERQKRSDNKMNQFTDGMTLAEARSTDEYKSAFIKYTRGHELSDVEKRAFSTAITSAGAAVPTSTHDEVMKKLKQTSALLPHITSLNLPGNVTIPVEVGESGAVWVDELDDIPETGDPIGSVKLGGFTLAKLIPVSIATESMSASAFEAYLVSIIADKLAIEIEKAILSGSGVGQPTGILTGVTWTAGSNAFTWNSAGETTVTTLEYLDMLLPLQSLPSGYLPGAAWCLSSATLWGDVASVLDAQGKPIFVPNVNEGFAGTILGKPVIVDDYVPAHTILFGDFRYYFMNFSQPFMFEKSRESGFRKATIDYRGVAVLDGKPAMNEAFVKLTQE